GWHVHWYDRERVFRDAAVALGGDDIDAFLRAMGQRVGPPGRPGTSLQQLRRLPRQCEAEFHPASSASVLHERGNLHELDARAYAIESCHAVQKRIIKKDSGRILRIPNVKVEGFAPSGVYREGLGMQSGHS